MPLKGEEVPEGDCPSSEVDNQVDEMGTTLSKLSLLQQLPLEIWADIFDVYFPKVLPLRLVCKHWNSIICNLVVGYRRRRITILGGADCISSLGAVFPNGKLDYTLKSAAELRETRSAFSNLTRIDIGDTSSDGLDDVSALKDIQHVAIRGCPNLIDVSPLSAVHTVLLTGCPNVTDVSSLKNVPVLFLSDMPNITDLKGHHKQTLVLHGTTPGTLQDDIATEEIKLFFPSDAQVSIPKAKECLDRNDHHSRWVGVLVLRLYSCNTSAPPFDLIQQSGALPRLIELLGNDDDDEVQMEAAWVITNIASGTSAHVRILVHDHDCLPVLRKCLASPRSALAEQALWAVGNIAGDGPRYRDLLLGQGCMDDVLQLILIFLQSGQKISRARTAVWTLSNLLRGKNPQPDFKLASASIPVLERCLYSPDTEVLVDSLWALSYLTDGQDFKIQAVQKQDSIVKKIVKLTQLVDECAVPGIRTIGNMVSGGSSETQCVIDAGGLGALLPFLQDPLKKTALRKEAAWALSNVTAGTVPQIQAVIDGGLFDAVMTEVERSKEDTIQNFTLLKELAYCLANLCDDGSVDQIKHVVKCGIVRTLFQLACLALCRTVCSTGLVSVLEKGAGITGPVTEFFGNNEFTDDFVSTIRDDPRSKEGLRDMMDDEGTDNRLSGFLEDVVLPLAGGDEDEDEDEDED